MCNNLPLSLKNRSNSFYLVVNPVIDNLKLLSGLEGVVEKLSGVTNNIKWAECIEIKLEYKNDQYWLVINPDIWIDPADRRSEMSMFIVNKKKKRYNSVYNKLIDCWKIYYSEDKTHPLHFLLITLKMMLLTLISLFLL